MKNGIMKRIIATVGAVVCSLCLLAAPVTAFPVQAASPDEGIVSPCADILEWVYAEKDGKMYKRLWNCTRQQWVGDWIYVCDLN